MPIKKVPSNKNNSLKTNPEKKEVKKKVDLPFANTYETQLDQQFKEKESKQVFWISLALIILFVGLCFLLGYFLTS